MTKINALRAGLHIAAVRQRAFAIFASTVFLLYLFSIVASDRLSAWESTNFPVLDYLRECDGRWQTQLPDNNGGTRNLPTPVCEGNLRIWEPFMQDSAHCDGRDAIVTGYLSKVRPDAKYLVGHQNFYFGSPYGRFAKIAFRWDLNDPNTDFIGVSRVDPQSRPVGIQDWGPWRLRGGCDPLRRYDTWYTTVEHKVIHPFWTVRTLAGPFPLPPLPTPPVPSQ